MAEVLSNLNTINDIKQRIGNKWLRDLLVLRSHEVVHIDDDFVGPVLDGNKWSVSNGGGASAASPVVSAGLANGSIVAITGTAGDGTADSFISSGRHLTGSRNASIKAWLMVGAAVTNVKIEVGLGDAIATAATHVVNSKSGNTFIATDGVCWIYDTADTGRGWDGMGVANGSAATRMTTYNVAPTASTMEAVEISLIGGVAYFSHYTADGKRDFGPVAMAAAVTSTVLLAPYVSVEARSATSKTLTIDRIMAKQIRTTSS